MRYKLDYIKCSCKTGLSVWFNIWRGIHLCCNRFRTGIFTVRGEEEKHFSWWTTLFWVKFNMCIVAQGSDVTLISSLSTCRNLAKLAVKHLFDPLGYVRQNVWLITSQVWMHEINPSDFGTICCARICTRYLLEIMGRIHKKKTYG